MLNFLPKYYKIKVETTLTNFDSENYLVLLTAQRDKNPFARCNDSKESN